MKPTHRDLILENGRVLVQRIMALILMGMFSLLCGCEKTNPDAVELTVEFNWQGYPSCDTGLPQMTIGGIPAGTKFLAISMYDHKFGFDHGEIRIAYENSGTIARRRVSDITGPCPPPKEQGRYEITVTALDGNDSIVGIGSKERYYPE